MTFLLKFKGEVELFMAKRNSDLASWFDYEAGSASEVFCNRWVSLVEGAKSATPSIF